ncbi:unnamed protein product [Pocillopora meandrina]|uniref:Uncharacterized protein n=1 Tax=Pocillopora meandrina TaxID=46732 RepID=A0AAU9WWI9_9CNID|nr:unnamed protein product [Pocillopora meandrina]
MILEKGHNYRASEVPLAKLRPLLTEAPGKTRMDFTRSKLKIQSCISTWLFITFFALLCLWCCDRTSAVPIARVINDPSKPPKELIDKVDTELCFVSDHNLRMREFSFYL